MPEHLCVRGVDSATWEVICWFTVMRSLIHCVYTMCLISALYVANSSHRVATWKVICYSNGEKPYQCTVCDKQFTRSTGEKPCQCTVCDKHFTRSGCLKSHMLQYSGEKPYQCTLCDKMVTWSSNLKSRVLLHGCTLWLQFARLRFTKVMQIHCGEKPYQCILTSSLLRAVTWKVICESTVVEVLSGHLLWRAVVSWKVSCKFTVVLSITLQTPHRSGSLR